jgi:membrane protease YdiL (CAAX protease family)
VRSFFVILVALSVITFSILLICSGLGAIPFCTFLTDNYLYFGAGSIHLGLFSAAMYFLWKKDIRTTLKQLDFPGDILRNVILSIAGFIMVIMVLLVLGVAAQLGGFSDEEAVYEKVAELPLWVLAFAIFLAPVSEELFFRVLLVPRLGVVVSSVLFGMMHFAYGSVVEMVGAAMIGMVLAVMYKISKSITPILLIHIVYNLISIIVMRLYL